MKFEGRGSDGELPAVTLDLDGDKFVVPITLLFYMGRVDSRRMPFPPRANSRVNLRQEDHTPEPLSAEDGLNLSWQIVCNVVVSFQPLASAGSASGASSTKLRSADKIYPFSESKPRLDAPAVKLNGSYSGDFWYQRGCLHRHVVGWRIDAR